MNFWKFSTATVVCCLITVPMQLFAGWWIADSLQAKSTVELILRLLGLVMVVIAAVWTYKLWSSHSKSGEKVPRAKASWLRYFSGKKK
jgi:membrane protein DedA with SNARE-associated domain